MDEVTAKAVGKDLMISTKKSIEVCNFVRGKSVQKAKRLLNDVLEMKAAVPFRRFFEGAGHKKGIGPGKYPIKTCKDILKIIELAEANAANKGLNTEALVIKLIKANKGAKQMRYGRQRGRVMKRANIEVVVEEVEKKEPKQEKKKPVEKKTDKKEEKPKKVPEEKKPEEKK